jgi:hypothetical protein
LHCFELNTINIVIFESQFLRKLDFMAYWERTEHSRWNFNLGTSTLSEHPRWYFNPLGTPAVVLQPSRNTRGGTSTPSICEWRCLD